MRRQIQVPVTVVGPGTPRSPSVWPAAPSPGPRVPSSPQSRGTPDNIRLHSPGPAHHSASQSSTKRTTTVTRSYSTDFTIRAAGVPRSGQASARGIQRQYSGLGTPKRQGSPSPRACSIQVQTSRMGTPQRQRSASPHSLQRQFSAAVATSHGSYAPASAPTLVQSQPHQRSARQLPHRQHHQQPYSSRAARDGGRIPIVCSELPTPQRQRPRLGVGPIGSPHRAKKAIAVPGPARYASHWTPARNNDAAAYAPDDPLGSSCGFKVRSPEPLSQRARASIAAFESDQALVCGRPPPNVISPPERPSNPYQN